ncbi:MAG TPA: XrtA system polysaccharide chain length determinant [Ideonella sp.]|nr:XrtA system polysaccharide chain length determinant [Ideonella sp.]
MAQGARHAVIDQAQALLERVWRHRWLALLAGWAVAVVSAVAIPLVPQRYEARSLIYVDTQSVLKPLMEGLAYQPDIDQQVKMLAHTVISRPNLEALVDRPDIGLLRSAPKPSEQEREAVLAQLTRQIKLAPGEAGLYTISYRDQQPERASRVVAAVLKLFVNSSSQDTRRDSENASQFIAEQIATYEGKLVEAESRLKEFKIRNVGVLGLSNQDYIARNTAISDELQKMQSDLQAAEMARDSYRAQLGGADMVPPNDSSETDASLVEAHKQLDELLRRFTEDHPDVGSARQMIARLEARRAQQLAGAAPGSAEKRKAAVGSSLVYQRMRVSLAEAEAEVASLRSRVQAERLRLEQLRTVAGRVPQVDAELAQLNRDYDVIRKNYEQLVARRESASIGVKLDESTRLADFRVVEPPRVEDRPVFPGRTQLALIAVVASLLAGIAAPLLADRLQPTFEDVRTLREFTDRPVAGTVIRSMGVERPPGARMALAGYVLALGALLVFQAGWLAWIVANRPA